MTKIEAEIRIIALSKRLKEIMTTTKPSEKAERERLRAEFAGLTNKLKSIGGKSIFQ